MKNLNLVRSRLTRLFSGFASAVLLFAIGAQLIPSSAAAAGQVTARSITMSTSAASAQATYTIKFTPVSTAQEVIIDFCSNICYYGYTT